MSEFEPSEDAGTVTRVAKREVVHLSHYENASTPMCCRPCDGNPKSSDVWGKHPSRRAGVIGEAEALLKENL